MSQWGFEIRKNFAPISSVQIIRSNAPLSHLTRRPHRAEPLWCPECSRPPPAPCYPQAAVLASDTFPLEHVRKTTSHLHSSPCAPALLTRPGPWLIPASLASSGCLLPRKAEVVGSPLCSCSRSAQLRHYIYDTMLRWPFHFLPLCPAPTSPDNAFYFNNINTADKTVLIFCHN